MKRRAEQIRRDDTGRILITREAAAALGHRNPDHVRKLVPPVAYDVAHHWRHRPAPVCARCASTSAALLDLDDVEKALGKREHRDRDRLRPLAG